MAAHGHEAPHYRAQRLRDALVHDPRVNELQLEVKIVGDQVFVTGNISSDERRHAVSDVVEGLVPELKVHNQTVVVRAESPGEAEDLT